MNYLFYTNTMKKRTYTRPFSLLLLFSLFLFSCVKNDDYEIPELNFEEPNIAVTTNIAAVKQMYNPYSDTPLLIQGENLVLEGYVVSSDKAGNLYKTLIIQDKPVNPTAGIGVSVDVSALYTFFEPGRKVYIKLNGLYIGEDSGELITLGSLYQGQVGRMSTQEFNTHILRSGEVAEIVPTVLSMDEIGPQHLNTFIQLQNMQFMDDLKGKSFGNIGNTYSVNRALINCTTQEIINLRNSGYANFKNQLLPTGNGKINVILSKYKDDYQLYIRSPKDIEFSNERCVIVDPPENAVTLPYTEDFYAATSFETVALPGWSNTNIHNGATTYEIGEYNNNKYAQVSAYKSGEDPLEVWLITPPIDLMKTAGNITLNFDTKDGYNTGEGLKVYISTDFKGDIEAATWTALSMRIATGSTSGYSSEFTPSGDINLSSYAGKIVYIGFAYVGADGGVTTSYQIDNISVKAN